MTELADTETIEQRVEQLNGWKQDDNRITRRFEFSDFVEAMSFVNKLVEPAESMGHHPDISISYNTVELSLTTHSEGGLTEKDFQMAEQINTLVS